MKMLKMRRRLYLIAFFACIFVILIVDLTVGGYYDSPEAAITAMDKDNDIDNLSTAWYNMSMPICIYTDVRSGTYQFNLTRLIGKQIFHKQGWRVGWTSSFPLSDMNGPIDPYDCVEISGNIYAFWGITANTNIVNATVNQQKPAILDVVLDGRTFYVWYVFGDTSLNTAQLVYN